MSGLRDIENFRLIDGEKIDNLPSDTTTELDGKLEDVIEGAGILIDKTIPNKPVISTIATAPTASLVSTDTSGFNGNLSPADDDVQKALDTLDSLGTGGDVTAASNLGNNLLIRGDGTGKGVQNSGISIDDSDNMSGANEMSITNGSNSELALYQATLLSLSTGLVKGGILSTGAGSDEYSVTDGFGVIVDSTTDTDSPTYKIVTWTGKTNITVTTPAQIVTRTYVDANGTVQQQVGDFTPEQQRNIIVLGTIVTGNGVDVSGVAQQSNPTASIGNAVYDLMGALGQLNFSGNAFTEASTDLTIKKSAGVSFVKSLNLGTNAKDPHNKTTAEIASVTFGQVFKDGSGGLATNASQTDIDPDTWDNGTGVLGTVSNNKWTNKRIYFFPSTLQILVQEGQNIFNNEAEALIGINNEQFDILPFLSATAIRTTLTIKKGTTDLSSADATFSNTGLLGFGLGGSAVGGSGTQDIQATYNLSVTPEFTTDATRGAWTGKEGTGNDNNNVYEVQNGAGTTTASITGAGVIDGTDITKAGINVSSDTETSTLTNKTVNGVTLSTAGTATDFLNEEGNYVSVGGGGGDKAIVDAYIISSLSLPAFTETQIIHNIQIIDTGGDYNTNGTFTAPRDGNYLVLTSMQYRNGGTVRLKVKKNTTILIDARVEYTGNDRRMVATRIIPMLENDTIKVFAINDSGTATVQAGANDTFISIQEL